jgi:hypothetical protein
MKLKDLVDQFSEMDPVQQIEKIRDIRRNKYRVKPATAARKRKAGKKSLPRAEKLMQQLTPAQIKELVKELERGS